MFGFVNNGASTLTQALTADAGDTTLFTDGDAWFSFGNGSRLKVTLTHSSLPDQIEILTIESHIDTGEFSIARASEAVGGVQEPFAWPIGTAVEARLTAAMLDAFVQANDGHMAINSLYASDQVQSEVFQTGQASFKGDSDGGVSITGFPAMGIFPQALPSSSGDIDPALGREVVGASVLVNLGAVPTWVSGNDYSALSIVKPSVADGFQYLFSTLKQGETTRATAMPFDGLGGAVEAFYDDTQEYQSGMWVPIEMPVKVSQYVGSPQSRLFVPTELGFVCFNHGGGASPSVSIGTDTNPTLLVNNQPLSQITGPNTIHRFPISGGGQMLDGVIRFALSSAEATGAFVGRFYWKGFFVSPKWWA